MVGNTQFKSPNATLLSWVELDVPTVKQVDPLFTHPIITKLASKHSRTPGQILLRWATQRGFIVIPKSVKPERMAENLKHRL